MGRLAIVGQSAAGKTEEPAAKQCHGSSDAVPGAVTLSAKAPAGVGEPGVGRTGFVKLLQLGKLISTTTERRKGPTIRNRTINPKGICASTSVPVSLCPDINGIINSIPSI